MDELKLTVAKNITEHRKRLNMTQLQLAEKLNYSDKAVSKWERAEALPDVYVMRELADIFGISMDQLIGSSPLPRTVTNPRDKRKKVIVSMLSAGLVWLVATVVFVVLKWAGINGRIWLSFMYAIPASAIVLIVFNALWGKRIGTTLLVSALIWSAAAALLLTFPKTDAWLIFIAGIPVQVLTVLWFFLKKGK